MLFEYPHPLTIVNNANNELEFIIKKAGPWTNRLFDWVQYANKNSIPTPITVSGPFGNSLTSCDKRKPLTFIATGIGITPLIAYLYYLHVTHAESPDINMHISHRTLAGFLPLLAPLADVVNENKIQSVHFYLTGTKESQENINSALNDIITRYPSLSFFSVDRKDTRDVVIKSSRDETPARLFAGVNVHSSAQICEKL
jgi:NAD(P)H-flavin reductase